VLRHLAAVVGLVACHGAPQPSTGLHLQSNESGALVVGEPMDVEGFWSSTCTKTNWHKEADKVSCNFQRVRLDVRCDLPCKAEPYITSDTETFRHQRVIPLGSGTYRIEAKTTRVETGEQDVQNYTIEVSPPDRVELLCLLDPQASETQYGPCSPDGVPATRPLVNVRALRAGKDRSSELLEVNGKIIGTGPRSLAELFPEARVGEGVSPGTYVIDVALAGVTSRYKVVAR
jgi:hypothetical protein